MAGGVHVKPVAISGSHHPSQELAIEGHPKSASVTLIDRVRGGLIGEAEGGSARRYLYGLATAVCCSAAVPTGGVGV